MECPSCHANSREGTPCCESCGVTFGDLCPRCGSENRPGAKFCSECGQRLLASGLPQTVAAPPVGVSARAMGNDAPTERRQLTVMFYDLAESTTIASQLDPEDLREIIGAFHRCVTDEVRRFGGFAARYVGDGALVYFGYPQAHENDPERAVAAGLSAVDAVSRLTLLNDYKPKLRIGIATGLVVVGDIVGTGVGPERDIAGETPNLAARLQALAEPGTVVVCATTRRLSGGFFECVDLGGLTLKGFAEPVRAWCVIGTGAIDSRFEAQRDGHLTALIGREQEIGTLLRCWQRARQGSGQVVLISGEAGIGKSRISALMLESLANEPHIPLRYFCSPHRQESPFAPCISQLERAAGLGREDSPARKREKLEAALVPENRHSEALALISDLLSIPLEEGQRKPQGTPRQRRERTMDILLSQLELLSRQRPVMAIYEDVHWIDPTSLELLERTVDRIARLPVLLVITFRPEFRAPWSGWSSVTALTLGPLNPQQARAVVEDVAGKGVLPRDVLDDIVERADGIPLFLEELTKAIIETGPSHKAQEMFADRDGRRNIVVPATLHASLMARLDHLGQAKEIAQIGAAIGREFSYDLLAAVACKDQAELDGALAQLTGAGLVFQRGVLPKTTFLFKHALVQNTAYATLLRSTRRQLHARIVESLEGVFPETSAAQPELLAHHCTEAGLVWKGAVYWLRAGRQALVRSAMAEATTQLQKGLAVLAKMPENAARNRHELEFQIALGKVLIATKGHAAPVTGETFARARDLCNQLGHPPQIVSVLHGQWTHALLRAELSSARRRANELLNLGETRDDPVWKVMGRRSFGVTCFPLGEFQAACDYLARGLELFDPARRPIFGQLTVDDVEVVMLYYSSWALLYLGHLDQARQRCDAALALARRLAQPFTLAHALIATILTRLVLHAFEEAVAPLDEVAALAEEHGIAYFKVVGNLFRGRCLAALGREHEAVEVLTRSLAIYRSSGSVLYLPTFLGYLAEAHRKAQRPEHGLAVLSEAVDIVERTQTRCDEADMHRLRGKLLATIGDTAAAEQSFRTALAVARRQGARFWELRAAVSLARLWGTHAKRRGEAQELIASVRGRFTEGFDTAPLREAEALIDELA